MNRCRFYRRLYSSNKNNLFADKFLVDTLARQSIMSSGDRPLWSCKKKGGSHHNSTGPCIGTLRADRISAHTSLGGPGLFMSAAPPATFKVITDPNAPHRFQISLQDNSPRRQAHSAGAAGGFFLVERATGLIPVVRVAARD